MILLPWFLGVEAQRASVTMVVTRASILYEDAVLSV